MFHQDKHLTIHLIIEFEFVNFKEKKINPLVRNGNRFYIQSGECRVIGSTYIEKQTNEIFVVFRINEINLKIFSFH